MKRDEIILYDLQQARKFFEAARKDREFKRLTYQMYAHEEFWESLDIAANSINDAIEVMEHQEATK